MSETLSRIVHTISKRKPIDRDDARDLYIALAWAPGPGLWSAALWAVPGDLIVTCSLGSTLIRLANSIFGQCEIFEKLGSLLVFGYEEAALDLRKRGINIFLIERSYNAATFIWKDARSRPSESEIHRSLTCFERKLQRVVIRSCERYWQSRSMLFTRDNVPLACALGASWVQNMPNMPRTRIITFASIAGTAMSKIRRRDQNTSIVFDADSVQDAVVDYFKRLKVLYQQGLGYQDQLIVLSIDNELSLNPKTLELYRAEKIDDSDVVHAIADVVELLNTLDWVFPGRFTIVDSGLRNAQTISRYRRQLRHKMDDMDPDSSPIQLTNLEDNLMR